MTSQAPRTVAVCAMMSLLTHSIVSPTFALISAGENTSLSMTTLLVSAFTGTSPAPSMMTMKANRFRPGRMAISLLEFRGDVLGMLLMALEDLEARLQQALEFGVCRRGDQCRL